MEKNLNKQEDTFDKLVRPYNKALAKAVFEKLDKEIMEVGRFKFEVLTPSDQDKIRNKAYKYFSLD